MFVRRFNGIRYRVVSILFVNVELSRLGIDVGLGLTCSFVVFD